MSSSNQKRFLLPCRANRRRPIDFLLGLTLVSSQRAGGCLKERGPKLMLILSLYSLPFDYPDHKGAQVLALTHEC